MIYTISKNFISFEEDQKRNYPNGGKYKTNAEERKDEESYHNKPNKKQKKGGALSSTLAVKDMSNALSQGGAEEPDTEDDQIQRRSQSDETLYKSGDDTFYIDITNIEKYDLPELQQIAKNVGLTNYEKMKKTPLKKLIKPIIDRRRPKVNEKIKKLQQIAMKQKEDVITYDINWNMKKKPYFLQLSDFNRKKLESEIYLNEDDISTANKFNETLEKYNITLDYDNSIAGQVNKMHDNPSNITKIKYRDIHGDEKVQLKYIKDRGICFEEVMLSQHQDILKKCFSKSKQQDFLPSEAQPNLQGIKVDSRFPNSTFLYTKYLYDLFNKFFELELKYYDDDTDYVEIQPSKFEGNISFKPYFCKHNGKWVLYNIWCDHKDYTGYVNTDFNKEVSFCVYKKSNIHAWSLTDFLNKNNDIELTPILEYDSKGEPVLLPNGEQAHLKGIKGEELHTISFDYTIKNKIGPFYVSNRYDNKGNPTPWLKIPLKDFNKIT